MAIMESDLFRGVSQRFITRIANSAEEQTYKKYSVIFKRGERASHFYVLVAGDVHIEVGETEETLAVRRPARCSAGRPLSNRIRILQLPDVWRRRRRSRSPGTSWRLG